MGIYRVRRSMLGKCILQERLSFPLIIGGNVDAGLRDIQWRDVDWKRAPGLLLASNDYSALVGQDTKDQESMIDFMERQRGF